jgi:WD40 repeat protein
MEPSDAPTIRCQQCGTVAPASAHFCPSCGQSFGITCQRCGTESPANTHFCPKCRWPLMLAAAQSQPEHKARPGNEPPGAPRAPVDPLPAPPAASWPGAGPQMNSAPAAQFPDAPVGPQSAPLQVKSAPAPARVKSMPIAQRVKSAPLAQRAKSAPSSPLRGAPGIPHASLDTYMAGRISAPGERGRMSGKLLGIVVAGVLLVVAAAAFVVLRGPLAARQPTSQGSGPGTVVLSFGASSLAIDAAAWSPDGQEIALGESSSDGQGGAVQVINATTGHVALTYPGWSGGLAWMPDGKTIISGKGDGTISTWYATSGKPILTFGNYSPSAPISLALSHNGERVAVAARSNAVDIWDAATGAQLTTYTSLSTAIHALAWSPDDSRLAAAGENSNVVQIWDATNGTSLLTYQGHATDGQITAQSVISLAWSPDGKEIASVSRNGELRVWDASAGSTLWNYHGPLFQADAALASAPVAWSPDGARIAFAYPFAGSQLFDATSGKVLYSHQSLESGLGIFCLAWSPDGTKIIAGGQNSAGAPVQVWLTK